MGLYKWFRVVGVGIGSLRYRGLGLVKGLL